MAGIKIVDLPAVGRDLAATDLFEMSLAGGTGSRKITGQEIMNASKLSVNNTPVINGTSGRIFFQGSTNVLQQSANLFWDSTNNRLGIGTSTPTNPITIGQAVASALQSSAAGIFTSNENASNVFVQVAASNDPIQRPVFAGARSRGTLLAPTAVQSGDAITTFLSQAFDGTAVQASAGLSFDAESNASSGNAPQLISFITGASGGTRTTKMQVRSNGNVLINTTTDSGFKLDVNGTARVSGNSFFATGTATGGNGVGIGTTSLGTIDINQRVLILNAATYPGYLIGTNTGSVKGFFSLNGLLNLASIGTETNSPFLFFSNNTERLRIFAGGNIGINTTTDDGYRLDVNGTARVQGNTTVALNQNAATSITVSNTTSGTIATSIIRASNTTGNHIEIGRFSPLSTTYKVINGNDSYVYSTATVTLSDIAILNDASSGRIKFATGGVSTAQMTLFATGNFGINTTTDAGFRLDVNGTARVSGNLELPNFSLILQSGISGYAGSGNILLGNNFNIRAMNASNTGVMNLIKSTSGNNIEVGGSNHGNTFINPTLNSGQTVVVGDNVVVSSAVLNVSSTTKGFLPPRMTQTQRNAIASPAIGLEIYQTDATEGKYIYKSSGWTYIG